MKPFLASLTISGAALAAFALLLTGAHVDTVTGVTAFYTNTARTGWVYPTNSTYTNEFTLGATNSIPIIYGGQGQEVVASEILWSQTPSLGGSFLPSFGAISSYRLIPSVLGPTESVFRVYHSTAPGDFYEQKFYFMVVPEPMAGLAVLLGIAVLAGRRRFQ